MVKLSSPHLLLLNSQFMETTLTRNHVCTLWLKLLLTHHLDLSHCSKSPCFPLLCCHLHNLPFLLSISRYTKGLKPKDISLQFLSGKGELKTLELNPDFINRVLMLPPWIEIHRAKCDSIKCKVSILYFGSS